MAEDEIQAYAIDGRLVEIKVVGPGAQFRNVQMSAIQLSGFIRRLQYLRARMDEPAALTPDAAIFEEVTADPLSSVQRVGQNLILTLLHPGAGWLAFALSPQKWAALKDRLENAKSK